MLSTQDKTRGKSIYFNTGITFNESAKIHMWIKSRYGKANHCENDFNHMSKSGRFEWANVTGKYEKDISNFKQLCVPCHRKLDFTDYALNKIKARTPRFRLAEATRKKVTAYTKLGAFYKNYSSVREAGEDLKTAPSYISTHLNGHRKSVRGYIFQYQQC